MPRYQSKFVLLLTPLLFAFHLTTRRIPDPVLTESGLVRGQLMASGVYAFKGIPFAAPPIGEFRWKPPQPVVPWKGVRDCATFGPSPMQPKPIPFLMIGSEFVVPQQPLSEDCLYLNIWTKATTDQEKKPVMIWIYGGGFMTGGAAATGYSGEALAQKGIIFVSFNYRLGIFGFLAHPLLTAESPQHSSGNYALMDQLAAIQWVKKNIAAFGGDPERITIAGQSAGAASVNCLLASPLAKGLFQGAIGESGSLVLENPILQMRSLKEAEKNGERFTAKLNAPDLKTLRSLSAEAIQQKGAGFFSPIVDGYLIPLSVAETYRQHRQNEVSLLTGWNADEGFMMGVTSKENFAKQAKEFGNDSALFKKYFPSSSDSESMASQARLSVDKSIALSQYAWALLQNASGNKKTFVYEFTRKPPASGEAKHFGAYHTAEIGYALHNLDSIARQWTPADRQLEKIISDYWVSFVKTGNPSAADLPAWLPFSDKDPQCVVLGDSVQTTALPDKEALDFLYRRYPYK